MNDIIDQTVNDSWHEGDFEHVSIKVNSSLQPVVVNFYRHEGGRTISASDCWWSSNNNLSYFGIQQGYDASHTHMHVWIAANAHASYNRYDKVYSVGTDALVDPCLSLNEDEYFDNVDYNPAGYDLYFEYDCLENLGEYEQSPLQQATKGHYYPYAHNYYWFEHNIPKKFSKPWLTFFGRFGEFWIGNCWIAMLGGISTASPTSPVYGDENHEWRQFTENTTVYGFGNPLNGNPIVIDWIVFIDDSSDGD